ncbi:hypothetical protein A9Z63_08475 [Moraxella lacunata]|uniref:Uncharacterized protein n=1 Tax=Moraxella lacunata TaxID=477 RepID=A0A1B8Q7S4_MORLA|nr:hypothetical protein A9Z63_08475 [Moraxella lacunata]OBX66380.1 hypothetical protein A9309_01355 [Moraxella lacunata]
MKHQVKCFKMIGWVFRETTRFSKCSPSKGSKPCVIAFNTNGKAFAHLFDRVLKSNKKAIPIITSNFVKTYT